MTPYSAVIIAYRRPDLLRELLGRLAAQRARPEHVLVVDNGGDLPADTPTWSDLPLTVITRPDNPGYAVAVNLAREALPGGFLLVLTHDAEFGPELGEALVAALEHTPGAGAAAPVLHRGSEPDRVFSAGGRLTPRGRALHDVSPLEPGAVRRADWLDGAIIMYDRTALDAIDWISEDYFLYFEDVDTGWRLARAGYASIVVGDAVATQEPGLHPTSLGIRNMVLFGRTAGIPRRRTAGAVIRRVAEESAVALTRGHLPPLRAAWRGWRDGVRGLRGKPDVWPPR
ncbi:glycosyltransferase family 2 protein [Agromyces intestinalis]|uniref:glycosyltransferase family 2 protein n=1 Tax=Agromyces intestinalis TaxID=2592652 RepID=UPI00143D4039|nr:glycosyltransferase family 2 protein [Agromyces intestinalis]